MAIRSSDTITARYAARDEHCAARVEWLQRKRNTFDFAASVYAGLLRFGGLTDKQEIAIDKCIDREVEWARERSEDRTATSGLDLSELPDGYYAVPQGETRLKVHVQHPKAGKWKGWTFVSDGAVYGERRRYGKQAPDGLYIGCIVEQLKAIVADPREAVAAYGRLTGRCGVCNRHLEDEESIARGIGPICAQRF